MSRWKWVVENYDGGGRLMMVICYVNDRSKDMKVTAIEAVGRRTKVMTWEEAGRTCPMMGSRAMPGEDAP